jgi:hypothetical protein
VKIHQFSVSFEAAQDRLRLRIISQSGEEVAVWLTRRLLRRVLPGLNEMAGLAETVRQPHLHAPDAAARQWVGELARQQHIAQSDFSTPYDAGRVADRPLGPNPLLITDVNLKPLNDGPRPTIRIDLVERLPGQPERSLQTEVTPRVLHGLLHVIEQGVGQTDWNRPGPGVAAALAKALAPYEPTPGAITPKRPDSRPDANPKATTTDPTNAINNIAAPADSAGVSGTKATEANRDTGDVARSRQTAAVLPPASPDAAAAVAPTELIDLVRPKYLN